MSLDELALLLFQDLPIWRQKVLDWMVKFISRRKHLLNPGKWTRQHLWEAVLTDYMGLEQWNVEWQQHHWWCRVLVHAYSLHWVFPLEGEGYSNVTDSLSDCFRKEIWGWMLIQDSYDIGYCLIEVAVEWSSITNRPWFLASPRGLSLAQINGKCF